MLKTDNTAYAIIIPRLNMISLAIIYLIRILMKIDVYYVDLDDKYKNLDTIGKLEKSRIIWFKKEYKCFSEAAGNWFFQRDMVQKLLKIIKYSISFKRCADQLNINSSSLNSNFETLIMKNLNDELELLSEQYNIRKILKDKYEYKKVIIISNNSFINILNKHSDLIVDYKYSIIFHLIFFDLENVKRIINSLFKFKFLKQKQIVNLEKEKEKEYNLEEWEVLFFPHKGIFYSNFYLKDQYYNSDSDSPFFKSKILHVSLGEKNCDEMLMAVKYYKSNEIPYIDIVDHSESKSICAVKCIIYLLKSYMLLCDYFKYGWNFIQMYFKLIYKINWYTSFVKKLKRAKIVLLGYEYLFPVELAFLFSINNIKVCASQERFIEAFRPFVYYILDCYLVSGIAVIDKGLKGCSIKETIPVGLVRVDKIFKYERENFRKTKYDDIKREKKLILALDYHLPESKIEDFNRKVAKIDEIREFYSSLLNLALRYPTISILIKGKILNSYQSPFISDIVEKINVIDNISIEYDIEKIDPYLIAEKADLTIACHTSLGDELLAAGRKVIFYEATDYLDTCFNYDNLPIIVKDYDDLRLQVEKCISGEYLNKEIIKEIQSRFYSDCYDGKVKERIQYYLSELYDGCCENYLSEVSNAKR